MTAPTTVQFLARFPEFGETATAVVEGAIAEADRSTPESVWGTLHYEAVAYLAAHLLGTRSMQIGNQVGSPSGSAVGIDIQSTLYGQEYNRLMGQLPLCGFAF